MLWMRPSLCRQVPTLKAEEWRLLEQLTNTHVIGSTFTNGHIKQTARVFERQSEQVCHLRTKQKLARSCLKLQYNQTFSFANFGLLGCFFYG